MTVTQAMLYYEQKLTENGCDMVIGVDEAGRGPLAGPVVAAAVVLGKLVFENRIDDSKKLTARQRQEAYFEIIGNSVYGVGIMNEKVIDRVNILEATKLAMQQAVYMLVRRLGERRGAKVHIIVDGNARFTADYPCTPIIRGDSKSKSIACASIVAKVIRDRIMDRYDSWFPQYGFARHKGYPTESHRQALKKFGPSAIHRLTFHSA
ncbi:MAG: ribonuclease HII [Candidatus Omnitrophota bacterium]|jgi:ribonuclease HII